MSVHVLRCPNCGADLQIAETSETIRCNYCGARCHVEGVGTGMHLSMIAKQIERIEGHAARTAAEIEAMRLAQARGLASQYQTDDAMRRAAAAQEAAAHEAAYAARLQSATQQALAQAGREWAAEQDAEQKRVVAFRTSYSRFNGIAAIGALSIGASLVWWLLKGDWQGRIGPAVGVCVSLLLGVWGWAAVFSHLGERAGRKFNEKAFLYGMREIPIKSADEKRLSSPSNANWGVLYLLVSTCLCIWAAASKATPSQPETGQPQVNGAPADNRGTGLDHPVNSGASNERADNSDPPSNSPAGNTAPPANGESAPASNSPRSD